MSISKGLLSGVFLMVLTTSQSVGLGTPIGAPELFIEQANIAADFDTFDIMLWAKVASDSEGSFVIGVRWDPTVLSLVSVEGLLHSREDISTVVKPQSMAVVLEIRRAVKCECPVIMEGVPVVLFKLVFQRVVMEAGSTIIGFGSVDASNGFPGGSSSFYRNGKWEIVGTSDSVIRFVEGEAYIRGDADMSGRVDITDALRMLTRFFILANLPICDEAADANGDGSANISDVIRILSFLFLGTVEPAPPFPACGIGAGVLSEGCMPPAVYANGCVAAQSGEGER